LAKKKERKREERGEGGGGRERRSQKNSKEKISCQFYELKSFKLHPHLDQRERKRKWGGGEDLKIISKEKNGCQFYESE
jgi:hypothetical protein